MTNTPSRLEVMLRVDIGEMSPAAAAAVMGCECPTGPGRTLEQMRYLAEAEARIRAMLADALIAQAASHLEPVPATVPDHEHPVYAYGGGF